MAKGRVTTKKAGEPRAAPRPGRPRAAAKVKTSGLGDLVWDASDEGFNGTFEVEPGRRVALHVHDEEGPELEPRKVRRWGITLGRLARGMRRWRSTVADALVDLKNESWRMAGEPPVTSREFASRLTPRSVSIQSRGVNVYFDDDGLFRGHSVILELDEQLRFRDVGI